MQFKLEPKVVALKQFATAYLTKTLNTFSQQNSHARTGATGQSSAGAARTAERGTRTGTGPACTGTRDPQGARVSRWTTRCARELLVLNKN